DAVWLLRLDPPGRPGASLANHVAKARSEALDLVLDRPGHIHVGTVRDVAVGPGDVPIVRRARAVEKRRLREEDEWARWMAAVRGGQHQQSDRSGAGLIEREQAVSGRARQQGTRFSFPEEHAGQSQR